MPSPGSSTVASPLETTPVHTHKGRVLVVDDHRNMVASLAISLRNAGFQVDEAVGGENAILRLEAEPVDVVVSDLRMDGVDGLHVLRRALELSPTTQVIIMTAFGSVESAVEAMKAGANEYVTKPFTDEELIIKVARAAEKRRLLTQVRLLSDEFQERYRLDSIIGRSAPMRDLLSRVVRVAQTDATVLVTGESGTGKELVARALHANSRRADRPFVPVNCAAIPETLLESELFGHTKGAYTGAVKSRRGLFEEAAGGTFFFDEIAETTVSFQAKLLRAIQEGEIRRVGENSATRVDVRIIAATNVELKTAIAEKKFREDLYYRLNVVPLRVPSLRERKEDIPLLAQHFLERFDERNDTRHRFSDQALERLGTYEFPGNVRELENLVEQAAALATGEVIGPTDVLLDIAAPPGVRIANESLAAAVDDAERIAIERAITASGGDLQQAGRRLRVSSTTLWRKMKRLNITR
jgi:two-component system response regulator HydG